MIMDYGNELSFDQNSNLKFITINYFLYFQKNLSMKLIYLFKTICILQISEIDDF